MTGAAERRDWIVAVAIVSALTALRLAVVAFTDLNIGPDEAQYWWWSKDLDFGYFSKPPMIAWIIAGMGTVCGDGEACVRAASPLIYGVASLLVFEAARILYGARAALWATLVFATLPGVSFSAALITTDVPLLMFWSLALVFLAAMLRRAPGDARWLALGLGISVGLAMLSKYAGAYFLLGLGVATLSDARVRGHVLGLNGAIALAAVAIVFAPNILWNLNHGFATVAHTAQNAGLDRELFNPGRLAEFFGAQFGVFGPVLMSVVLIGLGLGLRRARWPRVTNDEIVLLCLSLPVVAIGLSIAFLSKAYANWSAPAYVGLAIVATVWLLRLPTKRWLIGSTAFALAVMTALYIAALSPAFVAAIGQTNAFKLLRGWNSQAPSIVNAARERGFDTLLMEDREDMASLLYYTRDSGLNLMMWTPDPAHPNDHFQMTRPYDRSPERVLFITRRDDWSDVAAAFDHAREVEIVSAVIGKDRTRVFRLIELAGPKPK